MPEGYISMKKAIPIIAVTWILSLVTTMTIVYFAPFVPIGTNQIGDSSVTSGKIAENAIITTTLADGSVSSAKIVDGTVIAQDMADGSIITVKVADGAVTTAKIADGAATSSKIASGAITASKLADGAVLTIKLGDSSVTSAKILDGAVAAVDLEDNSIITVKIADSAVTTSKIANGAVTTGKIADSAVTNMKLAPNAMPFATVSKTTPTSTSSTTFVDMLDTNTTVTLSRTSHLLIIFTMEGYINPASIQIQVRALVGTEGASPYSYYLLPSSTIYDTWTTTFYKSSVAPGTYSIKIAWSVGGGTANVQKRVLTVIALPA